MLPLCRAVYLACLTSGFGLRQSRGLRASRLGVSGGSFEALEASIEEATLALEAGDSDGAFEVLLEARARDARRMDMEPALVEAFARVLEAQGAHDALAALYADHEQWDKVSQACDAAQGDSTWFRRALALRARRSRQYHSSIGQSTQVGTGATRTFTRRRPCASTTPSPRK